MYTISCEAHFDAAHFLFRHPGACRNLHGHRWMVRAYISSENLIAEGGGRGMVMDFGEIKPVLKSIADSFDHKLIVEEDTLRSTTMMMLEDEGFEIVLTQFRPTAENFAKFIFEELKKGGVEPSKVRVYESNDAYAEYSE